MYIHNLYLYDNVLIHLFYKLLYFTIVVICVSFFAYNRSIEMNYPSKAAELYDKACSISEVGIYFPLCVNSGIVNISYVPYEGILLS